MISVVVSIVVSVVKAIHGIRLFLCDLDRIYNLFLTVRVLNFNILYLYLKILFPILICIKDGSGNLKYNMFYSI